MFGCCLLKLTWLEVSSFFVHAWVNNLQTDFMSWFKWCLAFCYGLSAKVNDTNLLEALMCSDKPSPGASIIIIVNLNV